MKSNIIKNGSSWNISNFNKNPYNTQSIIKLFRKIILILRLLKKKEIFREKILMLNANKIKNELG